MKANRLALLICLFTFAMFSHGFSQMYIGIGPEFALPQGDGTKNNKSTLGLHLQLESRANCNLWYGIHVDNFSFDPIDDLDLNDSNYYNSGLIISPTVKYNFMSADCDKYDGIIPFIEGKINFSSLSNTDSLSKAGIGFSAGAGASYSFQVFGKCMMLELHALYSMPNYIIKSSDRKSFQAINVGLSLNYRL